MNSGRDNIATYWTIYRKGMRQLDTTYHSGMAGYLMDFGFGGFIGYGKGVSGVERSLDKLGMTEEG